MFLCERISVSFTRAAPYRFSYSVDLAITPEQLFKVLAEEESWPHWASVITNVNWTSPEPRGVGTTRTVDMRGGIVGDVGAPPALRGRIPRLGTVHPHGFSLQRMLDQSRRRVCRRLPGRGHPGRLPDDLDAGAETRTAGHAGNVPGPASA
jgi:hypothetical protein